MALRPQPLPLQFAGGVNTKTDAKQVPSTQLLALENATFIKQSTLAKRNGYEALGRQVEASGRVITDAVGMAMRDDEVLLFDGERAYSYREAVDEWANADELVSAVANDRPLARTGTAQSMSDHATNNGMTVAAWEDSRGGVWCSVVDASSGYIIVPDTLLDANGIAPRCVPCGTVLHIIWARPSTNRLYLVVVNPASPPETLTPIILTEDLSSTNPVYDACPMGAVNYDSAPAVIAWAQNGGGYRVGYIHPAGALGSPVYGLPSVATWTDTITGPIAVSVDQRGGTKIVVAWTDSQPRVRWLSTSSLLTSTGTVALSATSGTWNRITVDITEDASGNLLAWWAAELDGARDDLNRVYTGCADTTPAVTVASTARVLRGHGLVSRAFYDDGHIYAAVCHPVFYFPYVAVVRISADSFGGTTDQSTTCIARLVPGQSTGLPARNHVASVHAIEPDTSMQSRRHALCIGYRIQLDSENGDQFGEAGIKLTEIEFDHSSSYQAVQLARGLYIAGACPMHYDGKRIAEHSFHCAPDTVAGVTILATSGSGGVPGGVHNYRLVYEEIDSLGEWHPGAVSVDAQITLEANFAVAVTIPTYRLTSKRRVRIGVFRSPANDDSAFYRVSSLDPAAVGDNGYVLNDSSVDSVTFTDNMTDDDLLTKEPLYTNGGILSNDPTPMKGDVLAGGKNRLFATDPSDPNLVRYSKELLLEDTGVEWPVHLTQRVDPYGGRVVGIGVMDGIVYPFCETAIYRFAGPGPDADGGLTSQNAFSPTELVTSDCGLKSPNSICQTPIGIAFQSEKGIKLLDRSGQVQDIGAPVYAYNDQVITRATLLPDRHQILFLTDDGLTLLYDYERQQWSTFTNHEGIDAVVLDGTYHYLRNDSRVFRETPGVYVDDNHHITMRIETAWIKAAGYLQGFQRILWAYFIGTWLSEHTLGIRFRTDYNDAWSERFELNVNVNHDPSLYGDGAYGAGPYGGPGGDTARYQRKLHINRQCQAIQFRIEDIEATGDHGAAYELSEMLLIGGVLGPAYPISAARST